MHKSTTPTLFTFMVQHTLFSCNSNVNLKQWGMAKRKTKSFLHGINTYEDAVNMAEVYKDLAEVWKILYLEQFEKNKVLKEHLHELEEEENMN